MALVLAFIFATLADQVAATVGDDIILESEVTENAVFIASDPMASRMFSAEENLRKYVIDQLVANRLMLVQAEAESISVPEERLQSQVKAIIEGIKGQFPSEADFYTKLQEQNMTLEDLTKNIEERERTKILMQELIAKKWGSKILISPIAVRRFYDENRDSIATMPGKVKLAHILLGVAPSENELRKGFERAVEVYKLISAGGEFNVIAQEFSEDENSKKQGGMLGKIKKGETLEEFERTIFTLKPGVVSQPFPTRLGYHMVEVLNKGSDWVLARQVLIKVEVTRADTQRVENLAIRIRDLINSGANFDSLAKLYSNAAEIDLGDMVIKYMTPPYNEIVEALEPGKASDPILTPVGYQVLYTREKSAEKQLAFEELRDRIFEYLYNQELQQQYDRLIEELKQKTFVKIFPLKQ